MKLENLFEKEWYEYLSPFLKSQEFIKIGKTLNKLRESGVRCTPDFTNTFRAFKECPWRKLSCVILGLDPYPGVNKDGTLVADGLAFSSNTAKTCPVSLNKIFEAIDRDIYSVQDNNFALTETFDLTKWANQGVLLLNCALSFPLDGSKSGAHVELWQPFIYEVIRLIKEHKDVCSFILMGTEAKKYFKILSQKESFQVVTCVHPAASRYTGGVWQHERVFAQANAYLNYFNIRINW